jgi:hypothetical protein
MYLGPITFRNTDITNTVAPLGTDRDFLFTGRGIGNNTALFAAAGASRELQPTMELRSAEKRGGLKDWSLTTRAPYYDNAGVLRFTQFRTIATSHESVDFDFMRDHYAVHTGLLSPMNQTDSSWNITGVTKDVPFRAMILTDCFPS